MTVITEPAPARIRIGLLHRFDAQDVRSWSGTLYFMAKALQEHVGEVTFLGPDKTAQTKFAFDTIGRINRIAKLVLGKSLISECNRFCSRRLAAFFESQLLNADVDVLFAPVASTEIAYLKTDIPIVYLSDITWKNIIGYYPEFSLLSSLAKHEGENIEMRAIQKAKAVVYPSAWPAQTAREHYHAPAANVFEIPFGANLEEIPSRQTALRHQLGTTIELLWVGVNWKRKGGAVAFECMAELLGAGLDVRLTVCGCTPPPEFAHPNVRVFKFLNKHDPEQRKMLSNLFLDAHFLLFPTRAEAFGIVIAEASAHGLPCLATDTGGVTGALQDGVNGYTMAMDAGGVLYAEKIKHILDSPDGYERLVSSSRELFERRLNWDVWGKSMSHVVSHSLSEECIVCR